MKESRVATGESMLKNTKGQMLTSFIEASGIEGDCSYSGCVLFRLGVIEFSGCRQRVVEERKRSRRARYNQQALHP